MLGLFGAVFHDNPAPMVISTLAEGRAVAVNRAFTDMLGYTADELLGRPSAELGLVIDKETHDAVRRRLRRDGTLQEVELAVRTKGGDVRIGRFSGVVIDGGGERLVLTVMNDVTEERQAKEALRRERERFANVIYGTGAGTWEWNVQTGELVLDERWAQICGYTLAELEPISYDTWAGLLHPEDHARAQTLLQRHFAGGSEPYALECRMRHKAGHWVWVSTRGRVRQWTTDGLPLMMYGTHVDVTERKRAEVAVQAALARFESLMEAVPSGIAVVRQRGGLIAEVNEAAARMLGVSQAALVGRRFCDLLAHRAAACLAGRPDTDFVTSEDLLRRPDGTEVPVLRQARRLYLDGEEHHLETFVDISAQKAAQRALERANAELVAQTERANAFARAAEQASAAKSEFLAHMSHELRTPLNGITGMSGLLLADDLSPTQRQYADVIRASARALLAIIDDVLDLAKIEAGKIELSERDVDLQAVIDDAMAAVALEAHDKGIALVCPVVPTVPGRLRGDPGRLRQILLNLLGNAVKFTDQGEVALDVEVVEAHPDAVTLRFTVRDTGIGIPADRQAKIFDEFVQAERGAARRHGGTGLGLAISRELVALMGGEIGVESAPGAGAAFWFTARLGLRPAPPSAPVVPAGTRVLLAAPEGRCRDACKGRLAALGAEVEAVSDPARARAALRAAAARGAPYPLLLVDLHADAEAGRALADTVRQDPDLASTQIVAVVPLSRRSAESTSGDTVFDGVITRPMIGTGLRDTLLRALRHGSAPQPSQLGAATTGRREARVLVVEDHATNQLVARAILERLGLACDVAPDGRRALEALGARDYALVLMDLGLPEQDGLEVTRAVRARGPTARNAAVPIVAMTALATPADRARCFAAGMDGYIAKPVTPESLAAALAPWLPWAGRGVAGEAAPAPAEVFDEAALVARVMGHREVARRVAQAFVRDLPTRIAAIERHVAAGQHEAVRAQAHGIKGAAASVSAEALRVAAAEVEGAAARGDDTALRDRLRTLRARFLATRAAMGSLLQ